MAVAQPEALAGRGQHPHVGAALGDGPGQLGDAVDDVLAVVQDEEVPPGLQDRHDGLGQRPAGGLPDLEDRGDRPGHVRGRGDDGQVDQPRPARPAGQVRRGPPGRGQCEPGLPDATRADQGHDRRGGERVGDAVEVLVPADQAAQPARQVPTPALGGAQRRVLPVADLEDALLGDDAVEAEHAQVAQVAVGARLADVAGVEQGGGHARRQRLPAVPGGREPGGHDHRGAEVAPGPLLRLAGVQADPHPDRRPARPGLPGHGRLDVGGPGRGVGRPVEGDAERVAAGGEHITPVPLGGVPDQLVVPAKRRHRLVAVQGPQPGRVVHVGEAEGDRPGRRPQRRALRRPLDPQPLVVAEDLCLQLPQAGTRFDPQLLDEVVAGPAVGGQRVGLAPHPVERGHEQRPQPFPEGMVAP